MSHAPVKARICHALASGDPSTTSNHRLVWTRKKYSAGCTLLPEAKGLSQAVATGSPPVKVN